MARRGNARQWVKEPIVASARRAEAWPRSHLFAHAPAAPAGWEPGGDWEMECEKVLLVLHYEAAAHSVKFSRTAGAQ